AHAMRSLRLALALTLVSIPSFGADTPEAPVRLAIAGLVHGHVKGFLDRLHGRTDVQLVGIADPDGALRDSYRGRYDLAPGLLFPTVDAMLEAARPDAVAIFTSTYDHPEVVEACAARGVRAVMMEKPLAVSMAHAGRIAEAARSGRTQVL